MIRRWFVVDEETGTRYEPGHPTKAAAMTAMADRYADLPCVDSPDRFEVQLLPATPWAYAIPVQTAPC